jgi:nitrite reductase/ring-hydroxylating ferredoxin subunit
MSKTKWVRIAESEKEIFFSENHIAVVEAEGKKVCITRFEDAWHAFAYKCPHASGIMADGYIDATGNIVCPVHRYKFNIRNGRNTSGEGYYLKIYPVESRADGIYIGMPSGIFGFL